MWGDLSAEDKLSLRDFLKSSREALDFSEELFAGSRAGGGRIWGR